MPVESDGSGPAHLGNVLPDLEHKAHKATIIQGSMAVIQVWVGVASAVLSIIALVLTFGGLLWGFSQWHTEKTLAFEAQWSSDQMQEARLVINDAITCNLKDAHPDFAAGDKPSDPWNSGLYLDNSLRLKIADGAPGYRGLDHEVGTSLDFFEDLNACMGKICDQRLACDLFDDRAVNFDHMFKPYLDQQRAIFTPEYGRDFEKFHSTCVAVYKIKPKSEPEASHADAEAVKKFSEMGLAIKGNGDPDTTEVMKGRIAESCRRMAPDSGKT